MLNYTEITGYAAMLLLVVSFIPKKLRLIRILNFVACVAFVLYGILLPWKWPIIISNGLIAIIQLYHLLFAPESAND